MQKFRNVEMEMGRGNGYGQYYVKAHYRGKDIKAHTTNSEAWDYFNNDEYTKEDKEKHRDALRHCYCKIVSEYNKLYK